jgi:hypothetical protein
MRMTKERDKCDNKVKMERISHSDSFRVVRRDGIEQPKRIPSESNKVAQTQ